MRKSTTVASSLVALVCCALAHGAAVVQVTPDHASGVYALDEKVTWTVRVSADGKACSGKITCILKPGGTGESEKRDVDLTDGKAEFSATRNNPGALLAEIHYKEGGKDVLARGGAVFAPEKIAASAPPPDDFDAFWKEKIAGLNALPMNAQITPVDIGKPGIEYYKITLDNINGTKIQGQIAKPAGKTNLPVMLQVQWAGVYKLEQGWVTGHAQQGWLAMNISAHDLPIDQAPEFYKKLAETTLNDYPGIGNESRDTSYFLRMFLSCYRAVDYLTQRPEWNKKTLVVHGTSQGGWQTLVTAGMHPAVTAFAACVPAGCDHMGKQAGRAPGWPNWAGRQNKDYAKMLEAARYYDAMNFARHIKVPGIVATGLIDTTCPPEGVFATCNQIPGVKYIIMPLADHKTRHELYYPAFNAFLEEQKKK